MSCEQPPLRVTSPRALSVLIDRFVCSQAGQSMAYVGGPTAMASAIPVATSSPSSLSSAAGDSAALTDDTLKTLSEEAARVLRPQMIGDRLIGDVGAAVLSAKSGRIFLGVCIDLCAMELCAEGSAISAMITATGETAIRAIVAVWRKPPPAPSPPSSSASPAPTTVAGGTDSKLSALATDVGSELFVLPPCGRCREIIRSVDAAHNERTVVVLGPVQSYPELAHAQVSGISAYRAVPLRALLPAFDWPLDAVKGARSAAASTTK
jgi:cytidine deaminase